MSAPVDHTDVGAYALGLLEDPDREAFEAHLLDCARCQAELGEFGDMRGLFADVEADAFTSPPEPAGFPGTPDPADTRPSDGGVTDLAARRSAKERARRTGISLAAAAAAAVLLVAGVAIGGGFEDSKSSPVVAQSPHHATTTTPSGVLLLTGERHPTEGRVQGADGVSGYVALESKGWGSHVGLELAGVHGPLVCSLFVVGKDGRTEEVGSWMVPEKGYGVASNPAPLTFHGGTSLPKEALDRFEVRTKDGRTLLTVPM